MAKTIAVSGKGGVGKTTVAAMIIRRLVAGSSKTVLAVDADPNSCLGLTMGIEPEGTIADIREQSADSAGKNQGIDRIRSFEYGVQRVITEARGFDMLTMGRPEGPGCYCAANNLLRKFMDKACGSYDFVVIDNEAGMEHLSRRTTNNIDLLCIVAEPTYTGEITARRISDLAEKLPLKVKRSGLIWNKTVEPRQLDGIDLLGCVPHDDSILNVSVRGQNIFEIEENSPAFAAVCQIVGNNIINN